MVTNIAHSTIGENRMWRLVGWRSVTVGNNPTADGAANTVGSNILTSVDGDNTIRLGCSIRVDRFDLCMRMIGPDKVDMQLSMA